MFVLSSKRRFEQLLSENLLFFFCSRKRNYLNFRYFVSENLFCSVKKGTKLLTLKIQMNSVIKARSKHKLRSSGSQPLSSHGPYGPQNNEANHFRSDVFKKWYIKSNITYIYIFDQLEDMVDHISETQLKWSHYLPPNLICGSIPEMSNSFSSRAKLETNLFYAGQCKYHKYNLIIERKWAFSSPFSKN